MSGLDGALYLRSIPAYNTLRTHEPEVHMLSFCDLTKSFGGRELYRGLDFTIYPGDKLGLIGRNGAGKSTIFRLITGEELPDTGLVVRDRGIRIGFIPQLPVFTETETLYEHTLGAFAEVIEIQARIAELEHEMGTHTEQNEELEGILEEYGHLQTLLDRFGGYNFEWRARQVLMGIGFAESQFSVPMRNLSGGQRQRALLARLLVGEHDLILLDEPTNHMDLEAIMWLEEYLRNTKQAFVMISHDRSLLEHVVTGILDLELGKLDRYEGTYEHYKRQKAERLEAMLKAWEKQQDYIRKTEEFIRKYIAGVKTKQAQGRRKILSRVDRMERPKEDTKVMHLGMDGGQRGGKTVIEAEGLCKSYGKHLIFQGVNLKLERGQRVALLGPNGAGKSTLIKVLLGREKADKGKHEIGYNIDLAYFDQYQSDLNDKNSVIEEAWLARPELKYEEVRKKLGNFLFPDDTVDQKVLSLSGGERSRLVMLKMLMRNPNFLVMDEPTNHLDTYAVDALEEALADFPGTLLLISHDRSFLDAVCDRFLLLKDGKLEELWGGIDEYIHRLKGLPQIAVSAPVKSPATSPNSAPVVAKPAPPTLAKTEPASKPKPTPPAPVKAAPPAAPTSDKREVRPEKPKRPELPEPEVLMAELERIEAQEIGLSERLSDPNVYSNPDLIRKLQEELAYVVDQKDRTYNGWEYAEEVWARYREEKDAYDRYYKRK